MVESVQSKQLATKLRVKEIEAEYGMALIDVFKKLGRTLNSIQVKIKLRLPHRSYGSLGKYCIPIPRCGGTKRIHPDKRTADLAKMLGISRVTLCKKVKAGAVVVKTGKDSYELIKGLPALRATLESLIKEYGDGIKLEWKILKTYKETSSVEEVMKVLNLRSISLTKDLMRSLGIRIEKEGYEGLQQKSKQDNVNVYIWMNSFNVDKLKESKL